jgi:glycosyltransferase involved in cell wall biosynthesis
MNKNIVFCIRAITGEGGGAEKVFSNAVSELTKKGFSIRVLSFDKPGVPFYDLGEVPVDFLSVCEPNKSMTLRSFLSLLKKIRIYLKTRQVGVAVGFMNSAFIPLIFAAICTRVKIVGSEHAPAQLYKTKALQRYLNVFADFFLWKKTVTSADEFNKQGFLARRKAVVMENPLHIEIISNSEDNQLALSSGTRTILSVGTLRLEKRHDALIDAFKLISDDFPDVKLSIVGDGPERANLENRVRGHGLDNRVVFHGAVRNVSRFYKSSQFLVVCSDYESFGLVAIEALSYALPVLGFRRCEGLVQFVTNDLNGYLVDIASDEVTDLSLSMRRFLQDQTYLSNLKKGASCFDGSRYSIDTFGNKWIELLELK